MTLIIVLAVVALLFFFVMGTYNGLVRGRNKVEESFSTMDVYMKKRADVIPNLVNTVKGYAAHESETLSRVVALRNGARNLDERMDAENQMTKAVQGLMVQVERYPELKANQNFLDLQQQLQKLEEDIATSRRYYNGCVREQNNSVEQFPGNIIAGMFGFKRMKMYEAEESARQSVSVQF